MVGYAPGLSQRAWTHHAKPYDGRLCQTSTPAQTCHQAGAILERVWGWDYDGTARTVDNFVAGLRKKLNGQSDAATQIKTIPKVGYKLEIQ